MNNNNTNKPSGLSCLQTDDTLTHANAEFDQIEQQMSKRLESNSL